MMIYCHIWESKPFLKKLYRLARITTGNQYEWDVKIPDMSKHDYIRNSIRAEFDKNSNSIGEIIKKGFHTSLRNAFAHSEYSFNTMNDFNMILLHTYSGKHWDIKEISFDDWSKRFIYSALLSYYLLEISQRNRTKLIQEYNTNQFLIKHPSKKSGINPTYIYYNGEFDSFGFHPD